MAEGSVSYEEIARKSDKELKKSLGFWAVMFMAFSAIVGSGWLMAPLYSAAAAGPASLISWILGLVFVLFIVLAYAEISAMIPRSGSIVRYPQYAYGGFVSFLTSWAYIVGYAAVVTAEVEAIVSYLSAFFPTLMVSGVLTWEGFAVAVLFILAFFALNYYSVYLLGKLTAGLGWLKLLVPLVAAGLLLFYFNPGNFTSVPGGFVPMGPSSLVLALPLAGILYSYFGFRQAIEWGGEVRNPQRNIPRGLIAGFLLGALVYLVLQVAFIGAINWKALSLTPGNWSGLSGTVLSNGAMYYILKLTGNPALVAFSFVVFAMAILSPMPAGWAQLGSVSRGFYGMSATGNMPGVFLRLSRRKTPYVALVTSTLLSVMFMLPFPSWVTVGSYAVLMALLTYVVAGPIVLVLRRTAADAKRPFRLPAAAVMAALAFIAAYLATYWASFSMLWFVFFVATLGLPIFLMYTTSAAYRSRRRGAMITMGIIYWAVAVLAMYFLLYNGIVAPYNATSGAGLPLSMAYVWPMVAYVVIMAALTAAALYVARASVDEEGRSHIGSGLWYVVMLFSLIVLSYVGQFGVFSSPLIPFPWDTVIAAIVALAIFAWSVRSGLETKDLRAAIKATSEESETPSRAQEIFN
jgi:amino acid transporter